jgi:putative DNA primase/helicase
LGVDDECRNILPVLVPDDLAELPRWAVWRSEDSRKVPYRVDGSRASSADPRHWGELEDARAALASGRFPGLAFVFVKDDGLVGIDLDVSLDADGE